MNLSDRSLRAVTIVILALTFFGVLVSVYPITIFNIQSADKPIIPVWESGDAEQTAEQTEDDTPIPTLSSAPAQSETSGAIEMAVDPWASEVVETALREPFTQEPKKADDRVAKRDDDLPRAAFENTASRPADPVLPRIEPLPSESTITFSQDPALTSTDQYWDVTAQPLPPQTSPPDPSMDTETFPQPPASPDDTTLSPLPTDEMSPSPLPADEETSSP